MRVLVEIAHPAEVHFFQPLIRALQHRGDNVLVTAHYKPGVRELLSAFGIEHVKVTEAYPTVLGVVVAAGVRTLKTLRIARRFRPDVLVARVGAVAGAVGSLTGIPSVCFDDNDYSTVHVLFSRYIVSAACSGGGYEKSLGARHVRYGAVSQFLYTQPSCFTPDGDLLRRRGLDPGEPYVLLRLSSWQAVHDVGRRGLGEATLLGLAEGLSPHARVLVSAEGRMPDSLQRYENPVPFEHGLHVLAFARLYVGEGGSMAAEAACLGTPAIWVSPLKCGYLNMLRRRYGLVAQTTDPEEVERLALRWLSDASLQASTRRNHQRLLADSEDPLEFMIRLLEKHARSS